MVTNTEAEVKYNERITDISQVNDRLTVSSESGRNGNFDAVILTMPIPQLLQLTGTISSIIGKLITQNCQWDKKLSFILVFGILHLKLTTQNSLSL